MALIGRVFERRGDQLEAELWSQLPLLFIANRDVCLMCDGLVRTGTGWMESVANEDLGEQLAQVATMLVAAERFRKSGDRDAVQNMLEQALRQIRFAFDDAGHVPEAAQGGPWRELLDREGVKWPEPEGAPPEIGEGE